MTASGEPLCRTCYLDSLTRDERDRALAERVVSSVHYCAEHQSQLDRVMAPLLERGLIFQTPVGRYLVAGVQLDVEPDFDDTRVALPPPSRCTPPADQPAAH